MPETLLRVTDLRVHFSLAAAWPWQRASRLAAVDGVSLTLNPGRTLALVGESGCGKSTLARAIAGLVAPTDGAIVFDGVQLPGAGSAQRRRLYRDVQMIFQDPLASLDPRMRVGAIVAEPLRYLRRDLGAFARRERALAMLERVGLARDLASRYPHEFSGGQCQRIGIARALVVEPRLLICDEPVSALDVSIQADIVALLQALQAELGLAILFIAHDLAVVRQISDDVLVMYLGRTMETAPAATLFDRPAHPYTRALLSAVPRLAAASTAPRIRMFRELPSAATPPAGCVFHTRCPWARADCADHVPRPRALGGARVACRYAEAIAAEGRRA